MQQAAGRSDHYQESGTVSRSALKFLLRQCEIVCVKSYHPEDQRYLLSFPGLF